MLYRRVLEHVKDQNWTAVLIDLLIVVVGVFIGIQVANWNEARGDRAREGQILREIQSDLSSDQASYDTSLESALRRIMTINYIAEQAENSALSTWEVEPMLLELGFSEGNNYDDFIASKAHLSELWSKGLTEEIKQTLWASAVIIGNAQASTTAFDSLVSSGNLGIIQNQLLVKRLQDYRVMAQGLVNSQNLTYRGARDTAIDIGHRYGLSGFTKVDEAKFLALVASTPEIAAGLQTVLAFTRVHFKQIFVTDQIAEDVMALIDEELSTRFAESL